MRTDALAWVLREVGDDSTAEAKGALARNRRA